MNSRHGMSIKESESFWESEVYLVLGLLFLVTGSIKIVVATTTFTNNPTLSLVLFIAGIISYSVSFGYVGVYRNWWD